MARKLDINDPTDIDIIRALYSDVSQQQWQEYIDFSFLPVNKFSFTPQERDCLKRMSFNAGLPKKHSDKDMAWGLSIIEKIEKLKDKQKTNADEEKALCENKVHHAAHHVTFRVAWHDNKWDGTICKDPVRNFYCSGFNSLLSERLRRRKEKNLENEIKFKGKPITEEYVPPCFWGVNIFGNNDLTVKHDNPADTKLDLITETLPAKSVFSWPFAVSFVRTKEMAKTDGAYPKNLESVRIPQFQSRIKENKSVAFLYAKFSNPLTEEEQQYLVVGCGLITDKGDYTYFGPKSIIEQKKNSKPKYRNFPSMNWTLRYSFQDPNLLVRMPYHEYLDYVNQPGIEEETKQKYLDRIKVAISEPELNHCFKYVAMDVDDDEAIFILSKMRKTLLDCKNDGIVPPNEMQHRIDAVEQLLNFCWKKRTYFPGFSAICREILNWDNAEFKLDDFLEELIQAEQDEYHEKFVSLIEAPGSDKKYKNYSGLLKDVKEKYEDSYGLTSEQFLHLCMLNLKPFQYKRILSGKLRLSGDWKKTIDDERASHSLNEICDNPYLLFEEYEAYESLLDPITGEEMDGPIDLFKIDIAYFPDQRFGIERTDLQRTMRNNDKRRLRAVTIRYLRTLENTGHCFADAADLEEAIKDYPLFYDLGVEYVIPARFFENLKNDYIIHFEENESKIKVISENDTKYFYLYEVYNAEAEVEEVINQLIQNSTLHETYGDFNSYLNNSCKKLREKLGNSFDEDFFRHERTQLYANLYRNRLFVLAGNPGSGKSYELLNIIKDLKSKGETYFLLAPTGKAALRLRTDKDFEGIEFESFTIDKILADCKNSVSFKAKLRTYNNLIIDEMSMVDLMTLRDFLRLINVDVPSLKRLILVGDPNQLPAIGYGKVLKDILYFLKTHPEHNDKYIELQTNCRQELAESKILEFSEGYVTDGEISDELRALISSGVTDISKGFRLHYWQTEAELYEKINAEFEYLCSTGNPPVSGNNEEKINQLFKLANDGSIKPSEKFDLEYFQVLSPYRSEFYGVSKINDYVQKYYKPSKEMELIKDLFKQSDKIIRTKNYYENGKLLLSNGSIGIVQDKNKTKLHFPELEEPMLLTGDEGMRSTEQDFFELAYAITVHKSQGSGFNHCFFVLPKKTGLLSKELVYTAITRSRESISLFVQGSPDMLFEKSVLEKARNRSYTESRRTTLLLDQPYRYYNLEVDGRFIKSRVELLIYQVLKTAQDEYGKDKLSFEYELKPVIEGQELPMKTDFTLFTNNGTWYWEHLGRLGNKNYEWTWHNVKRKSYEEYGAINNLLTTHERNGINPDKIKAIIDLVMDENLSTEDKTNRYSLHHYSLR